MSRADRDNLLLSGLVKQVSAQTYEYIGQEKSYPSFSAWAKDRTPIARWDGRRFLPGSFIFEHGDKRRRELMETPESLGMRVTQAPA